MDQKSCDFLWRSGNENLPKTTKVIPKSLCMSSCFVLACLPAVNVGPGADLKGFPAAETARRAHVSDFLPGAILQLCSVHRGSGPNSLLVGPITSCSDRTGPARKGGREESAVFVHKVTRNKSEWCMFGRCRDEAEVSALHAADQSVLQREDTQR